MAEPSAEEPIRELERRIGRLHHRIITLRRRKEQARRELARRRRRATAEWERDDA